MAELNLSGRVALVTGAGRGIGMATARRLAEAGASVVLNDIDGAAVQHAAHQIAVALGRPTLAVPADVTNAGDVDTIVATVISNFGRLDILINNAGVLRNAPVHAMTEDDWDLVVDVHLKGAFLCTRAATRHMIPQRYGRIVNVSSTSALGSSRGQANYAAAKAGIIGLTRTLAIELGPHNIAVNAVAPGATISEMTRATAEQLGISFDEYCAQIAERVPIRRIGQPEEIADVICFLASEAARYVSGETIFVAGGAAAH